VARTRSSRKPFARTDLRYHPAMLSFATCNAARLRRFNAAFAERYGRPPSSLRAVRERRLS